MKTEVQKNGKVNLEAYCRKINAPQQTLKQGKKTQMLKIHILHFIPQNMPWSGIMLVKLFWNFPLYSMGFLKGFFFFAILLKCHSASRQFIAHSK